MSKFRRYAVPNVSKEEYERKKFIGIDLDGTLATKVHEFDRIGEPIWPMVNRVKQWLLAGKKVKIFTARCSIEDPQDLNTNMRLIREFCVKYIGQPLEVVCQKSVYMYQIWDDKSVHVESNTGKILSPGYEQQ